MNLVLGSASYNDINKAQFKRDGMKLLRNVVKVLDLPKGTYNLRYNAAGIACSGDCTLHADTFYVRFNLDCMASVLVRTCQGQKDYTGGPNNWYSFEQLAKEGATGLAQFISGLLLKNWQNKVQEGMICRSDNFP